jgi:hypothetical protein
MNLSRAALFCVVMMTLGACSSKPVLLNASEQGVVVRYNPSALTRTDALAAAQASCQRFGRNAILQDTAMTGEMFATYSCVK